MSDPVAAPEPPERPEDALARGLEQLRWMAQWVGWPRKRYGTDRPPDFLEPIQPDEAAALLADRAALVAAKEAAEQRLRKVTATSFGATPLAAEFNRAVRERDALAASLAHVWKIAAVEPETCPLCAAARAALAGLSEPEDESAGQSGRETGAGALPGGAKAHAEPCSPTSGSLSPDRSEPVTDEPPPPEPRPVPVMVRGGRVHAPSKYRVHGEYETFEEAAEVVHALRRDPEIAWAYIPDEYAPSGPSVSGDTPA